MRGNKIFAIIMAIVAAIVIGFIGYVCARYERGYFAVGGEMFLPVLAFSMVYRSIMYKEEER